MGKLHPDKLLVPDQTAVGEVLRHYGISDFSFEPITRGLENMTIRVTADKTYVLRIYRQGKATAQTISFEIAFQDALRDRGIPIPKIYPNARGEELTPVPIDGKTWNVILMEFVEGESHTEHYSPELIINLAAIQARMHLFGAQYAQNANTKDPRWINLSDGLANRIKDLLKYDEKTCRFIERARSFRHVFSSDLPHGYNHLDLDLYGNVVVKDNAVQGILDFDDLQYSPCAVCLGYTLWAVLYGEGEVAMREYLREYEKLRPLSPAERAELPAIILFRNYVVGIVDLVALERSNKVEKMIRLQDTIQSLRFTE